MPSRLFFFILLFASGMIASAKDFSIRVQQEKDNITPGGDIPVRVLMEYPPEYQPCAWLLTAFQPDVPEEFLKALGLMEKLSRAARPEWRYVNFSTTWFPAAERAAKEKRITLRTTEKWPPGDYRIVLRILFRRKVSPSPGTDKYIGSPVSFTIE